MKKLLKKLKHEFNKFIGAIRKKIADKKAAKEKVKREKQLAIEKFNLQQDIKQSFEKNFNVKHSKVKTLMGYTSPVSSQTDPAFLHKKLMDGKLYVNKIRNRMPFFYEPDICDIHNENPDREGYPTLESIKKADASGDQKIMNPEPKIKAKIQNKADFVWKTRS